MAKLTSEHSVSQQDNTANGTQGGAVCMTHVPAAIPEARGWLSFHTRRHHLSLQAIQRRTQGQPSSWSQKCLPPGVKSQTRSEKSGGYSWETGGEGLYSQELLSLGCVHPAKLHWPGLAGHTAVDTESKLV